MKTETQSINDVLVKNATSFYIPPFQRAYAWGKTEIDRYFNDIRRIVASELNNTQPFFHTIAQSDRYPCAIPIASRKSGHDQR